MVLRAIQTITSTVWPTRYLPGAEEAGQSLGEPAERVGVVERPAYARALRDRQVIPVAHRAAEGGEPGHQVLPPVRRQPDGSSRSSTSSTVTAPTSRPTLSHTATPMKL